MEEKRYTIILFAMDRDVKLFLYLVFIKDPFDLKLTARQLPTICLQRLDIAHKCFVTYCNLL